MVTTGSLDVRGFRLDLVADVEGAEDLFVTAMVVVFDWVTETDTFAAERDLW